MKNIKNKIAVLVGSLMLFATTSQPAFAMKTLKTQPLTNVATSKIKKPEEKVILDLVKDIYRKLTPQEKVILGNYLKKSTPEERKLLIKIINLVFEYYRDPVLKPMGSIKKPGNSVSKLVDPIKKPGDIIILLFEYYKGSNLIEPIKKPGNLVLKTMKK